MSWSDRYIVFKKIYGLGDGELGFLKGLTNFQGVLSILVFLKLYAPALADNVAVMAPLLVAIYIGVSTAVGLLVDRWADMVRRSTRWDTSRNPDIQLIIKKLDKLEKQMSSCSSSRTSLPQLRCHGLRRPGLT